MKFSPFSAGSALLCVMLASGAQASAGNDKDAEKVICRTEGSTGSIMKKKVCHTASEWEKISAESAAARDRMNEMDARKQGVSIDK